MEERFKAKYFFSELANELMVTKEIIEPDQYVWESLKRLKEMVDRRIQPFIDPSVKIGEFVVIEGNVLISKNTVIHPNVVIKGPAIIGEGVEISPGAYIRPYSVIGDYCVIGHGAEIKHSLLLNHCKVQTNTFVGDSIIGKSARVGSGTITANRRFDQKEVGMKFEGIYYPYGSDFFGCILGDYSRLGANVTTLPGTMIGPYTWVMPSVRLEGFVEEERFINSKQDLVIKENKKQFLKD